MAAGIVALSTSLPFIVRTNGASAGGFNAPSADAYAQQRPCGQDAQRFYALWQTKSDEGLSGLTSWFQRGPETKAEFMQAVRPFMDQ